ncbi:hypothetical protein QDR37_14815 [Amnibacterium sp. CER49]|uniref:DUF6716 putative glycosyltransferase n=1 Tax=Amnibacterium sp. CER49 TaxID=3039161 RepID=UPI0024487CCB|nr:DUF6716 putative glycosyltransferase [Amnibacterium sp. CER49]MDH2445222.1 hypothetical protein [Amnibacterium sp. CER49]
MPQALLVADFDSALKYAGRLADALAAQGAAVRIATPTTVVPTRLGAEQIRTATDREVEFRTWPQLLAAARAADVVVPVSDGPTVQRFVRDVHGWTASRLPVFGAGYVGMALYDLVGGYLMRSLADVLAVSSRSDLAAFETAGEALGLPTANLLLTGLALLPAAPAPPRSGPIRTVVFADQPTVPARSHERIHIWDRLLEHAQRHPDRRVLLRPRHRAGERTFHRMGLSPERWAATRRLPENLRIDHTPIVDLLPGTDLLLTVSSTAALEAIAAGCRVAFVDDVLGDAALNPPLLPSGLLRRFDEIDADAIGTPREAWLDDVFPARTGPAPAERFAARLLEVAADPALRTHETAWSSAFHAGRRETDRRLAALGADRPLRPRRVAAAVLRRGLRVLEG